MAGSANIDGAKVKALREALGLKQEELGELAKISGSHISRIETGSRPSNEVSTLTAYAAALAAEPSDLLLPPTDTTITPSTVVVDTGGRGLRPRGRDAGDPILAMQAVPIIGYVPAGTPIMVEQVDTDDFINVEPEAVAGVRRPRAVIVRGDSMEPRIHEGEIAIFDPDKIYDIGDVVIALVDNETTIKQVVRIDGLPRLMAANDKYGPVNPDGQDERVQGVVVWVQPRGRKP